MNGVRRHARVAGAATLALAATGLLRPAVASSVPDPPAAAAKGAKPCQLGLVDLARICVHSGRNETGEEFDVRVTNQLTGRHVQCITLPARFHHDEIGSVQNDTLDDVVVVGAPSCAHLADARILARIPPETAKNLNLQAGPATDLTMNSADLPAQFRVASGGLTHQVRKCTYGLLFDANRLTCDLAIIVNPDS